MELRTISEVSRGYGVSTRMLRYYEQAGLLASRRRPGYAYRVYDEEALARLEQILILRRLRVPVKQIATVLDSQDAQAAIRVFRTSIGELDEEIAALSTIRDILSRLMDAIAQATSLRLHHLLTQDDALLAAFETLSVTSINFKEDQTMDSLAKASDTLRKLTDVRIIYLPPATVAAAHFIGDDPEQHAGEIMDRFVLDSDLCRIKPDLRNYGFNHPNPKDATGFHGYELWVTIPDDMEVPAPLTKKHFPGGRYAAHMIQGDNFGDWDLMVDWVKASEQYEFAGDFQDQEHMCGLLEEMLDYIHRVQRGGNQPDMQLDLLMPIREKKER
ncbi:effector binding domain-containing protein [Eubacteriales bacterium OttesenSCG-928-A19]|nr:effector binding domain-containing protein [Eubacteriales bacterium OttesenSCG-928-A19]